MSLIASWNSFFKGLTNNKQVIEIIQPVKKPYRKPSDTTKLTKQMYDFVIKMKTDQEENNELYPEYETTQQLCDYLNIVFGTNFSRTKLSNIWNGKINREDLPDGITYTKPF